MKRLLLLFSIFLFSLCALASCGEHTHEYGAWHTEREPSCTREGLELRECSCGEREERTIEKAPHAFGEWEIIEAASCTMSGERAHECECGEREEEDIPAPGHTFGEWSFVIEPTYFTEGKRVHACECGERELETVPCLAPLFNDDFDGDKIDKTKWSLGPEWIRGNGAAVWDLDMVDVDGEGHLVIRAEWDAEKERVVCGAARTAGHFAHGYGYYEASIKFSVCEGTWGAFWLICGAISNVDGSAADGVEIDVIESIRNERGGYNAALHYDGYGDDLKSLGSGTLTDIDIYDGEFHTFGVDRTEEGYSFYIDGELFWHVDAETCDPCPKTGYMILSIEAAAWAGAGNENCIASLPSEMVVDYVRAYPENPYN